MSDVHDGPDTQPQPGAVDTRERDINSQASRELAKLLAGSVNIGNVERLVGEMIARDKIDRPPIELVRGVMSIKGLDDASRVARMLIAAGMVPERLVEESRTKRFDLFACVLSCVLLAVACGFNPLTTFQKIYVVNQKPTLYGDAIPDVVYRATEADENGRIVKTCEQFDERFDGVPGTDGYAAVCIVKRRGLNARTYSFSMGDAKAAGYLGKSGPWSKGGKGGQSRMMQMRARGFACRDVFADALNGLGIKEEMEDWDREARAEAPDTSTAFVSTGDKAQDLTNELRARREPVADAETKPEPAKSPATPDPTPEQKARKGKTSSLPGITAPEPE